jgi:hypothetical protein
MSYSKTGLYNVRLAIPQEVSENKRSQIFVNWDENKLVGLMSKVAHGKRFTMSRKELWGRLEYILANKADHQRLDHLADRIFYGD